MKRKKYSEGSGVSAHKSIGDLDLSLSGAAEGSTGRNRKNYFAEAKVTAKYGPFKFEQQSQLNRIKDRYKDNKFRYKDRQIGYTHKTKSGVEITASAGKNSGTLSIFKKLK